MRSVMRAAVILHNMIVEDEGAEAANVDTRMDTALSGTATTETVGSECAGTETAGSETTSSFEEIVQRYRSIRNEETHYQLRNDLVAHLWQIKGEDDE